jgi:hypothetical protein
VTLKVHHQVAGLLGDPLTRGVGGDTGQVHAPRAVLYEEQHVQAAQEHGVDVEEVRSENRRGLGGQEASPVPPGSPWRGVDARVFEDLPHRRRRDLVSKTGQLAVDTPVPPGRVVPRHLEHQFSHSLRRPGPPGSTAPVCPSPPDQVRMPAQQAPRGGEQRQLAEAATGH